MTKKKTVGKGTFHLGDVKVLLKEMKADSIDMIFTDPPYKVTSGGVYKPTKSDGTANKHKAGWHRGLHVKNDGKAGIAHNDIHPREYMKLLFRVMKPSGHCYVMTNTLNLETMLAEGRKAGFHLHNVLMWQKNNKIANRWYMKEVEFVVFFGKKPAKAIRRPGSSQIKPVRNLAGKDRLHPTQKPVLLMKHYIRNSTLRGETVLDPFAGSGSTAIAAESLGRRWIMCEIDTSFANVAFKRIKRYVEKRDRKKSKTRRER